MYFELSQVKQRRAWATVLTVSALASLMLFWIIYLKPQPRGGEEALLFLPVLNCVLNGLSACCLIAGFMAIKKGRAKLHMRWMVAAFICSTIFLVSYILHHHLHGDTKFPEGNNLRPVYLSILFSHVLLSVVALPMILMTFFASLSGRFVMHKKLARFTFPIWLYVSVTGVVIFLFLKWAEA